MPYDPRYGIEDWHCAHCRERSGMYGHHVHNQATAEGLCPNTIDRHEDGTFSGFHCKPGHVCGGAERPKA